jgi:hypothetical protein
MDKVQIEVDIDDFISAMTSSQEWKLRDRILGEASDDDIIEQICNRGSNDFYRNVLDNIPQNLINEYAEHN